MLGKTKLKFRPNMPFHALFHEQIISESWFRFLGMFKFQFPNSGLPSQLTRLTHSQLRACRWWSNSEMLTLVNSYSNSCFSTLINFHANSRFSTLSSNSRFSTLIKSYSNSCFSTLINFHANSCFSILINFHFYLTFSF